MKGYKEHHWSLMKDEDDSKAVYFVGELVSVLIKSVPDSCSLHFWIKVFPDMLDDYANLRPLKDAANLISQYEDWPALYDLDKLSRNQVKVSAAT